MKFTIKKLRLLSCAVALVLCLSLQSCFTAGLWASGMDEGSKAGLTPFALGLDVLTLPAQLAVIGHRHDHHRQHRRSHHRRSKRRCR